MKYSTNKLVYLDLRIRMAIIVPCVLIRLGGWEGCREAATQLGETPGIMGS